jgi:preprotein translocase subunit SecF
MLGAIALRDFALALFVGLFVGSYSSIFIATPILAMLKEREPKYRALREKYGEHTTDVVALQAAAAGRPLQPAAAAAADEGMVTVAPVTTGLTHPPRPRRKTRR